MKNATAVIALVSSVVLSTLAHGACRRVPGSVTIGAGSRKDASGHLVLSAPANIQVVGSIGDARLVFVGVGGGGEGGSAGGSGFASSPRDNGGGGGGGAGAAILAFAVTAERCDAFRLAPGNGGKAANLGGAMGTNGQKGADGTNSLVRRAGKTLLLFPGGIGGGGGIGSTHQPAGVAGGNAGPNGGSGGAGGADSSPGAAGDPSLIEVNHSLGGTASQGNGGGGGGGGASLCIGGNGGNGGTFAGAPADALPGGNGIGGSGGGGAGARGEGGEKGLPGGSGGGGVIIVFWGDEAKDFPTAVAPTPIGGLTLSPAAVAQIQAIANAVCDGRK